jgi:hypothetical protein
MKRTTVRELGQRLPIGNPEDGKLIKTFEVRPYKARVDRHLSIYREANPNLSYSHVVTYYVAMILRSVGSKYFTLEKDGAPSDETLLEISQLFFADVMYIYLWSRLTELGSKVTKAVRCPVCDVITTGAQFDLMDADVNVAESLDELELWVDLRKGFALRGDGRIVKRVKLHPVKWVVMHHEGVTSGQVGQAGYAQLQHSIVAVDGFEDAYTPTEAEIDDLHKIDAILLDRESNRVSAGLDMTTVIECPGDPKKDEPKTGKKCGFEITDALDWTFESFFGSSFALDPPTKDAAKEGEPTALPKS